MNKKKEKKTSGNRAANIYILVPSTASVEVNNDFAVAL
jgi:hypothetical protein